MPVQQQSIVVGTITAEGAISSQEFPYFSSGVDGYGRRISGYGSAWIGLRALFPGVSPWLGTPIADKYYTRVGDYFDLDIHSPVGGHFALDAAAGTFWRTALARTELDAIVDYISNGPPEPDTTAPTIEILSPVASGGSYTTHVPTVAITGLASDNVAVASITVTNETTSADYEVSGLESWSASAIALAAGSNTISVRATDTSGNFIDATFTLNYEPDTTAPELTILTPAADGGSYTTDNPAVIVAGLASDNIALASVSVRNMTTSQDYSTSGLESWGATTSDLAGGANTVRVRATDTSGNFTDATFTLVYEPPPPDTVAPEIEILTPVAAGGTFETDNSAVIVAGLASDNVALASVSVRNLTTSQDYSTYGLESWGATTSDLAEGSNTIRVRVTDTSGNFTDATFTLNYEP